MFAVSLAQGGPPPNFMRNWSYTYLATGDFDRLVLTSEDVTAQESRELISKVTHATTEELPDLIDDILSCGYTGVICLGKKDEILRTIVLHYLARLLPMLQDMRKGLQLYNLQKVMELDTELCQPLFVPLEDDKPDADFIMAHCTPHLSEKGMMRHTLEMDILNNFQDFLQEAEDSGVGTAAPKQCELIVEGEELDTEGEPNIRGLTVPAILQWLTGQAHKPILPSEKNSFKIHIKFNHDCYTEPHAICFPTVTACSNTIMFPTAHMKSYAEFRNVMALALRFGNTFSRI
nr:uncharacterized protein LOC111838956 [Paramormyrops kingsleyae]